MTSQSSEECIICLDGDISNNLSMSIKNLNNELFFTNCECNYSVHPLCVMNWLETKPSCPICHQKIQIPYEDIQYSVVRPYSITPPEIIEPHIISINQTFTISQNLENTQLQTFGEEPMRRRRRMQQIRNKRQILNQRLQKIFYLFLAIIIFAMIFFR
jgi:hypothetical protein